MTAPTTIFGIDWMTAYFAMVDTRDVDEFLTWYADDARFRFANAEPAHGKAAIRAALEAFYAQITAMRHERTGAWADADSGAFEAIAHFTTTDGRQVALPAVSTLRVSDGLVRDFRFVMDATPIMGAGA